MKKTLAVIQARSLREIVEAINNNNKVNVGREILKEDIVQILKDDETFFFLYYK